MAEYPGQKITYCGKVMCDGPWASYFDLRIGPNPSFGMLFCDQDTFTELSATPGTVDVVGDLVLYDGTNATTITLHLIHLIKAVWMPRAGVWQLIIADDRVKWQNMMCVSDYNTYTSNKTLSGSEYPVYNVKGPLATDLWTFSTLNTDLFVTKLGYAGAPTSAWAPTRKPMNIRGRGMTVSDVIAEFSYQVAGYLVVDPTASPYGLVWKQVGIQAAADTTTLAAADGDIHVNRVQQATGMWVPLKIRAMYAVGLYGGWLEKEAAVTGGVYGHRTYYTNWANSGDGMDAAQEYATEIAANYPAGCSFHDRTFVGLQNLKLSTEIHSVHWEFSCEGTFTHIKRWFPLEKPPQIPSSSFSANGFEMGGGGGAGGLSIQITATLATNHKYTARVMTGEAEGAGIGSQEEVTAHNLQEYGSAIAHAINPADNTKRFIAVDTGLTDGDNGDRRIVEFNGIQNGCS